MKRNILSIVIGLAVAIITFLVFESINSTMHPAPKNLDYNDGVAVKDFYEDQPFSLWLMVLVGWFVGSFLCGLLIKWISKNDKKKLPIIAGGILTLSAIANFFSLPHPTWFIVISLLIFIPSTILGHKLYKIKTNEQL